MDLDPVKPEDSSHDNTKKEEGEVNESSYLKLISVINYFVREFRETPILEDDAVVEQFPKHLTNL